MASPTWPRGVDITRLSHLPGNSVYQRPQHRLTRFAREHRVFYVKELRYDANDGPRLDVQPSDGVRVGVPHLPVACAEPAAADMQARLLDALLVRERVHQYVLWYCTPMALAFTTHLAPAAIVHDCMDELSCFANAPAALKLCEAELRRAAIAFTGGQSLFAATCNAHANAHGRVAAADAFLRRTSWDGTWRRMGHLLHGARDAGIEPARAVGAS